ncbi:Coenzyme F420 hydrogenase/dehydrogenase, beta subunit C-terminal domain [Salinibaculum salinum]|uniref:Coenzyme F420 hydrogenase/dehydrogenase, beta subunit C-terminal domain n=1 Tax=Salinibaculum salinum TaxID=3131996 RepID=UPI0030EB9FA8
MATDEDIELVEDAPAPAAGTGAGEEPEPERGRSDAFPGVPESGRDGASVPPINQQSDDRTPAQTETIPPQGERPGDHEGADDGCNDGHCTCGSDDDDDGKRAIADGAGAEVAGGSPTNVTEDGELTDLEFTEPKTEQSQPLAGEGRGEQEPPDKRVGVPEGVDLDTPGYSIRSEMNDIETPDEKTWFMELDEAVIDDGRCIQCGTCVAACPSDSIGIGDDGLPELVKMCTGCSLCWDFCPRGGMRYERQWKITGGEDNVKGAGDPITEFSARVTEDWREDSQDGGAVTAFLTTLMEKDEIDGALIATESDEDPWKADGFMATTPEEVTENTGTIYNQTMALGHLDFKQWEDKFEKDWEDISLALVGTPCEIEGISALQDFEWEYGSQEEGVRAIDYKIALMCTKNFNYERLIGDKLQDERGIDIDNVGKMDVLHGKLMVDDLDGERILEEDIEEFHDAALKGCDECADFTGFCADLTVGSVGSSDEYSSVIVRNEQGMKAWELTEEHLDYHDLEDKSAVGKLQGWDKKKAFEALERPFDPDAPRFIDYTDHAENYGTVKNPHDADH